MRLEESGNSSLVYFKKRILLECFVGVKTNQLQVYFNLVKKPDLIYVAMDYYLYNYILSLAMFLSASEALCFQGFKTPKDTARRIPTEMPLKRSITHAKI